MYYCIFILAYLFIVLYSAKTLKLQVVFLTEKNEAIIINILSNGGNNICFALNFLNLDNYICAFKLNLKIAYSSPIATSQYPYLGMVSFLVRNTFFLLFYNHNQHIYLIQVGLSFTAAYFVYQMKSGGRNILIELLIAVLASFALGFGTLFIMLSFGLYI